jgi:hypothetical protein
MAESLRRCSFRMALGSVALLGALDAGEARIPGTKIPGGCDVPVAQRTSETGCYLTATLALPKLPSAPIYWHVYS